MAWWGGGDWQVRNRPVVGQQMKGLCLVVIGDRLMDKQRLNVNWMLKNGNGDRCADDS